ncbi:MAG TPA: hypothetical protein VG056_13205 [Pirellulales bacterium]|jgi:hypothetical protein|nr:hypothetical protein [Pirellulales bacterium]
MQIASLIVSVSAVVFIAAENGDNGLVAPLIAEIKNAGPIGAGQKEVTDAWRNLADVDVGRLPEVLAGLDDAGPLAANWIRSAVDAIVERAEAATSPRPSPSGRGSAGDTLPREALERFLFDTRHAPRGRRLAYEILLRGDPALADRVLPKMLNDPSLEMRRDAVARVFAEADKLAEAEPEDKPPVVAAYQKALDAARDLDQVNRAAERLRQLGQKVDLPRHFGFITAWHVIGPFDNRDKKGLAVAYPPERETDFAASCTGQNGDVKWRDYATTDEFGQVDLNRAIGKHTGAAAYAAAEFASDRDRPIELRLGTENACKLWLNGKLLVTSEVYHSFTSMDQFVGRGTMKAGRNLILVKLCQNEQTEEWAQVWQFQLRVCDATGNAILPREK